MPRPAKPRNVARARRLRAEMTLPEVLLWQILRGQLMDTKFRRQHPLGDYVLDFYCPVAKLCIEIDGIAHDMADNPARDIARDAWLTRQGIEVLRIPARDVLTSPESVAENIVRYCLR